MTASAYLPTPEEQRELRAFAEQLERAGAGETLYVHFPGEAAPLPVSPVLARLLRKSVKELAGGRALTLIPGEQELSTFEAAALLGVSRPFLISSLLRPGRIPHHMVGTHRRVALKDVLAYLEEREKQYAVVDEMTALAQEAGLP